jgi:hypothetical protein
MAVMYEEDWMG